MIEYMGETITLTHSLHGLPWQVYLNGSFHYADTLQGAKDLVVYAKTSTHYKIKKQECPAMYAPAGNRKAMPHKVLFRGAWRRVWRDQATGETYVMAPNRVLARELI